MKKNFGEMPYYKAVKVFQKVRGELSTLAVEIFEKANKEYGFEEARKMVDSAEKVSSKDLTVAKKINKMADPEIDIVEFWRLFPGQKEWEEFCKENKFAEYKLLYSPRKRNPSKIAEAMCVLLKNLPDTNFKVTECCPYCGAESTYKAWKIVTDGYAECCQECKKPIMICSLCTDVRCDADCGWHQKNGKSICWRTTH